MPSFLSKFAVVACLAFVLSACGPAPTSHSNPEAEPTQSESGDGGVVPAPTESFPPEPPAPAIAEDRFVELDWPAGIRVGDSDFIRLALVPGDDGTLTPTASAAGRVAEGEPIQIPNLYETHNALAVAELSAIGLEIDRTGEIGQPLLPGEAVEWVWTVAPRTAGTQVATLALQLQFIPKVGGDASARSVWARRLTIEGETVLGLSGRAADVLGVAGSITGGVLGFPFADKLYGWLWRRVVKRKTRLIR